MGPRAILTIYRTFFLGRSRTRLDKSLPAHKVLMTENSYWAPSWPNEACMSFGWCHFVGFGQVFGIAVPLLLSWDHGHRDHMVLCVNRRNGFPFETKTRRGAYIAPKILPRRNTPLGRSHSLWHGSAIHQLERCRHNIESKVGKRVYNLFRTAALLPLNILIIPK